MHKFILGENPMAPDSGGHWIIHLPEPQVIIEAVHNGEKFHSKNAIYTKIYEYTQGEVIQLRLHFFFTTEFGNEEARAMKMLDKAWHWYRSYLEWEDENIDINEIANEN